MLPIFAVTILLLLSASFTSSRIYIHQTKRAAVSSNLEILSQTATSLSLVNDHISGIAVEIQNTPLLGGLFPRILMISQPSGSSPESEPDLLRNASRHGRL